MKRFLILLPAVLLALFFMGIPADAAEDTVSRIAFLNELWRLEGSPMVVDGSRFDDVTIATPGCEAVFWATGAGITNGVSPRAFAPDVPVTGQQAVLFLYRTAGLPAPAHSASASSFANWDKAAPWAEEAAAWAAQLGLLDGLPAPDAPLTPAQAAQLFERYGQSGTRKSSR